MKYVLLIAFVLVGQKLLAQQTDEKKPVMVFEQNANAFYKEKSNDINADQKMQNLAKQLNMKVINGNILNAIKTGSLTRNQRALIDFTQTKKYLSDLPASYYDAALAQFP
jgi:hypothetical protein